MKKGKTKKHKKNILITGAAGHLGSVLLNNLFKKDYSIFVLEKTMPAENVKNVEYLIADISDKKQLYKYRNIFKKIDICIHLAAFVPKNSESDNFEDSFAINIVGSLNIAELLAGGSSFIYANTCEVYNLNTFYAASKLSAEQYLKVVCQRENINFISLRFSSIYGPGETIQRAIPNFIKSAINDKNIVIFGDGEEKRSYLYIEDAVRAIVKAISCNKNDIFDISSSELISILGLAKLIKKITKSESKIVFKKRIKNKKDIFLDVKKAKKILHFSANVRLADGLKKEIEYFKKKDKPAIFLDLDGTILDVSERIYRVYKDILQRYDKKFLDRDDYLRFKKQKISINKILEKTKAGDILSVFKKEWIILVEKPKYLKYDKLSEKIKKVLFNIKKNHSIFLITQRRNKGNLYHQLREHKIFEIFEKILICKENVLLSKRKTKLEILEKYKKKNNSIIIGDTEDEILVGRKAKITTVAVTNGMRSWRFLKKYNPNFLISNIAEFKNIII